MTTLSPDELAARYDGDARRRENTIALAPARWTALEADASDWGVGVFCYHDGSVLLVREGDEWLLPGGTLEPGETFEEAVRREAYEETGVVIEIEGLAAIAEQTFVSESNPAHRFDFRFATFLATAADPTTADDPGLAGEGIDEAKWVADIPENTFERDLVVSLHRALCI